MSPAEGLYFREWRASDAYELTRLFDTDEMNRWTPLPYPFGPTVAADYIATARSARERTGTLQLGICASRDGLPIGEVLLFPSGPDSVELAYAVGAGHRGNRVGARAVVAVLDLARLAGARRAILTIAQDNMASQLTAVCAGFVRTDTPLQTRERKGFVLKMETWERHL